jgi:hypothetical protein
MGVFKGVAEWIYQLDNGRLSFIDTPLYANTTALHSHKDMMLKRKRNTCAELKIVELSFREKRGIVQVDSDSSLQWTLLCDMVLE